MRKINYSILLFVLSLLANSCIFMHYDDSESLGDDFYYLPDGKFSSILYNFNPENKSSRSEVIPPLVTDYSFDESYIIARTKGENQVIKYWFLEKSTHLRGEPLQPMDSIEFYKLLSEKNINLSFED